MSFRSFLKKHLTLPDLPEGIDLDSPQAILTHSRIIKQKKFLREIYRDFYTRFQRAVGPSADKTLVELGSGGGFIKELLPDAITSDVPGVDGVDWNFYAEEMPFANNSIDAFFLMNVFHHIKDPRLFLNEAQRCMKPSGKVFMIEPANTFFARLIYQNFHQERFDPSSDWTVKGDGRMSDSNQALPWIIFVRDRERFAQEYPGLTITKVSVHTPIRYLISGGLSLRQLLPGCCYRVILFLEWILTPLNSFCAMFMTVELTKKD